MDEEKESNEINRKSLRLKPTGRKLSKPFQSSKARLKPQKQSNKDSKHGKKRKEKKGTDEKDERINERKEARQADRGGINLEKRNERKEKRQSLRQNLHGSNNQSVRRKKHDRKNIFKTMSKLKHRPDKHDLKGTNRRGKKHGMRGEEHNKLVKGKRRKVVWVCILFFACVYYGGGEIFDFFCMLQIYTMETKRNLNKLYLLLKHFQYCFPYSF